MTPLTALPELDEVASNPQVLVGLSKSNIVGLLLRSAVVQSALVASLTASEAAGEFPAAAVHEDDGKMLTVDEAALRLRRSRQWIYRHAKGLPFVRRLSRKSLLVSEAGLQRWLDRRKAV